VDARKKRMMRSSQNVNELEKNATVWRTSTMGVDATVRTTVPAVQRLGGGRHVPMTTSAPQNGARKRIQSSASMPSAGTTPVRKESSVPPIAPAAMPRMLHAIASPTISAPPSAPSRTKSAALAASDMARDRRPSAMLALLNCAHMALHAASAARK
jgi:hypothetical protein